MKELVTLNENEKLLVNAGGLVGAAAGYSIGVGVGAAGVVATCIACRNEDKDMALKAAVTVFTGSVVTCTAIGAAATGIV